MKKTTLVKKKPNVNPIINPVANKLKLIDLFAGTGAFSLAFHNTNKADTVFANDMVDDSKTVYDINFQNKLTKKDLNIVDVKDIPKHDILTGGFPCFIAGTLVLTYDGYKSIENVTLDDKLLTHTGEFQEILNLQEKIYTGDLYKIKVSHRPNSIICTPEHPFYVREKIRSWNNITRKYEYIFTEPKWKTAEALRSNDYMGMVINNKSSLEELDNSDNDSTNKNNNLIPEYIQNAPSDYISDFLSYIENGKTNIITSSENVAYGVQRLYLKLGRIFSINRYQKCNYKLVEISNDNSFIEDEYFWSPIDSLESAKSDKEIKVYNFEVEKDNSYIVENTICHNCQPFSIAGKQAGFQDSRSNVFWKIIEIINYHKPECVILENVKNLCSHDKGNTFQIIKSNLEKSGYHVTYKVLNTSEITGIPQNRERIYIVCFRTLNNFKKFNLDFPAIQKRKTSDFFEQQVDSKYYYTSKSAIWKMLSTEVTKKDVVYQYRRVYVRENKSGECPTLTANMGTGGHNVPIILDNTGIRKLTPRECFNFQGFPTSYKLPDLADSRLYKLAGNAVTVSVVNLIAKKVTDILS